MHDYLVTAQYLQKHIDDPDVFVFDCHYVLQNPSAGVREYEQKHIPGAEYLDLGSDLSGTVIPGASGRHPLPDPVETADRFRQAGVNNDSQVILYERRSGPFAARAWWLFRWLGHEKAAIFDGGMDAWTAMGGATTDELAPMRNHGNFTRRPSLCKTVDATAIERGGWFLVDGRSRARFEGTKEWVDSVSGRIPGAVNAPYDENFDENGFFLSKSELRRHYQRIVPKGNTSPIVCYCGSGVTACASVFAMSLAGYPDVALYPGSWSEWITVPGRPVARGP